MKTDQLKAKTYQQMSFDDWWRHYDQFPVRIWENKPHNQMHKINFSLETDF